MEIFLNILLIIGIVLGVALGIVLLLILLVAFVPIRYFAKGSVKNKTIELKVKASWLLHILTLSYDYQDPDFIYFRVFGICFRKTNIKDKDAVTKDNDFQEDFTDNGMKDESKSEVTSCDNESSSIENRRENQEQSSKTEEEKDKGGKRSWDSNKKDTKKESKKKKKNNTTDKGIYDMIKKVVRILKSDTFKKVYYDCGDKIMRLIKHILPKNWHINALVGFEDPYYTGQVCAYSGIAYPWIYEHLSIKGDFEQVVFDVDGYAKGRIRLFTVGILLLKIYFDKELRKLIKMFKTEEE